MAVSFDGVHPGDRVRLTAGNGDVVEITVMSAAYPYLNTQFNAFYDEDWDRIEILSRGEPRMTPDDQADGSVEGRVAAAIRILDGVPVRGDGSTHYDGCWKRHTACLALMVKNALKE